MASKMEEYLKRQIALGYEPSLNGMDEEDFDYVPSWAQNRPPAPELNREYGPVDRDFTERIFRMFGRKWDPNWQMPDMAGPEYERRPASNTIDSNIRDAADKSVKRNSKKGTPKHGMGSASAESTNDNSEGRYSFFYSKDDNLVHMVDNQSGSLVQSWECRSNFVPGFNDKGQPRESLPVGTYRVTAEINKNGFKDQNGRSDPAYGTFYITTGDPRGRDFHGGGTGLTDPFAPRQGWVDTYGCPRMQNADGEEMSRHIIKQGSANLHVVQGPVRFGPIKQPGEDEQAKTNNDSLRTMFPGLNPVGPY